MSSPATWRGLAQPLPGGLLVVGPRGVWVLSLAVQLVRRSATRGDGGVAASRELAELESALEVAAEEARRFVGETAKPPIGASEAVSGLVDPVGVEEVAAMQGCSRQWARRLCASGVLATAVKRGGVWWVERAEVQAAPASRRAG